MPTAATNSSSYVYIYDKEESWIPAKLLSLDKDAKTASVLLDNHNQSRTLFGTRAKAEPVTINLKDEIYKYYNASLPLQNVDDETGTIILMEDMINLGYLHEAAILFNLRGRLCGLQKPYTRTGDIVIAMNPYQWMNELYSEEERENYAKHYIFDNKSSLSPLEPHVYEVSSRSFYELATYQQNQSILVSGESGAGKTETVKILMNHLASIQAYQEKRVSKNSSASLAQEKASSVIAKVLDSNPLLEAFGNAMTLRNDNSSRFGKYIQLQFEGTTLAGSICTTYLLEKSRVVGHSPGERSYHIFYYIIEANTELRKSIWSELEGATFDDFKYFLESGNIILPEKSEARNTLTEIIKDLAIVGIEGDVLMGLLRSLCVVMQLGNIIFAEKADDSDASKVSNSEEIEKLADLLKVSKDSMEQALLFRTVVASHDRYKVPQRPAQAKDSADALAKEIYKKIFDWLVTIINRATCASAASSSKIGTISLLDIFGFESFAVNRFEQLCINYCNEKIQQKFNFDVFQSVVAEYEAEEIPLPEISAPDNTQVLNLIEGKMGLIAILNEECLRPRGNDLAFVSKAYAVHGDHECLIDHRLRETNNFTIHHYAGRVTYDVDEFINKNTDTLASDLADVMSTSGIPLLKECFPKKKEEQTNSKNSTSVSRSKGKKNKETVGTQFKHQLQDLMTNINATRSRYIRCIKPNEKKEAFATNNSMVIDQLRCAGVVAAVTVARSAYPNRMILDEAWSRFHGLAPHVKSTGDVNEDVTKLLNALLKPVAQKDDSTTENKFEFTCGKTRIYFTMGTLEHLESLRVERIAKYVAAVQAISRRYLQRKRYIQFRCAIITLQSHLRSSVAKNSYRRARSVIVTIQCALRCFMARSIVHKARRNYKATIIQCCWRRTLAFGQFKTFKKAAIKIQSWVRCLEAMQHYKQMVFEARENAKMENQILNLQKKLEEAENKAKLAEEKARQAPAAATVIMSPNSKRQEEKQNIEFTVQQQHLMDESGKMLEYLRKEVFKLRSSNTTLKSDFDSLKEHNQRLMDANASAGASFAALNNHAKQLARTNQKLSTDLQAERKKIDVIKLEIAEAKEEIKMKQATYVAEVHSRLQYQRTMGRIVDLVQERCRDDRLVDDVITLADDCEADYMNGPTGVGTPRKSVSSVIPGVASKLSNFLWGE